MFQGMLQEADSFFPGKVFIKETPLQQTSFAGTHPKEEV